MEINRLVDLNSHRTAPLLNDTQVKKLLKELESNISKADWVTIGIMAPSNIRAVEALQSISKKYSSIKFISKKGLNQRFFHSKPTLKRVHPQKKYKFYLLEFLFSHIQNQIFALLLQKDLQSLLT